MGNINNNTLYIVLLKQTDPKAHCKPFCVRTTSVIQWIAGTWANQEPHFCTSGNTHTKRESVIWVEVLEVGEMNKTNGPSWNLTLSMVLPQPLKKHIGSLIVQSGQWKVCQSGRETEQWLMQREFSTEAAGHSPCSPGSQNGSHTCWAWATRAPQALAWIQQPQNRLKTTLQQSTSHLQGHINPYHAVTQPVSTTPRGKKRISKHLFPPAVPAAPFGALS